MSDSTTTPPATTPPVTSNWHDGIQDADTKAWVENKGFHKQNVEAVVKSYRALEQFTGKKAETMVEVPVTDDPEAWGKLYTRLGRPEAPDKYEMTMPAGETSDQVLQWSRKAFFDAGLTAKQAKMIAEGWNKLNEDYTADITTATSQKIAQDQAELDKAWGVAKQKNEVVARGAAVKLGLDEAKIAAMASAVGLKATMEMLYKVGDLMGEQQFIEGNGTGFNGMMTPAQARVKEQDLMLDPNFRKMFLSGNKEAVERINGLRRMAVETKK
jgi:hypothetical protein